MAKLKFGVDVGGTFTDVVGINEDGKVYFAKTPSTPEDQSIGVLNGIRALLEELGVAPDCVTGVAHGTTVATNTLLVLPIFIIFIVLNKQIMSSFGYKGIK